MGENKTVHTWIHKLPVYTHVMSPGDGRGWGLGGDGTLEVNIVSFLDTSGV